MVLSKSIAIFTCGLLPASSLVLHANEGLSKEEPVCVVAPLYEDPEYINEFIENFLEFTEPTSKLAFHLNSVAEVEYKDADLKNWKNHPSGRVTLTDERIEVLKFGGTILLADLLNYRTLEKQWPGHCKYVTLQASNMFWVRKGMEQWVREKQYAVLAVQQNSLGDRSGAFWDEMVKKGRGLKGWGPPEGSFFPASTLSGFSKMLEQHVQQKHTDEETAMSRDAVDAVYLEAFWLQTYALNFDSKSKEWETAQKNGLDNSVCYRHMVEKAADYDKDSVPIEEVKQLEKASEVIDDRIDNTKIKAAGFFAVKRVNRDMHHPTTKYIMSLARK